MRSFLVVLALSVAATAHPSPASAQNRRASGAPFTGHVRVYCIAADELDWTYVPSGRDQALTGRKDDHGEGSSVFWTYPIADMVRDNPGTWLFHRHMNGHFGGGMYSRFAVTPR